MDDGLEGFGVGGAAEDDKAGQPVAVGVLGGGDEPGRRTRTPVSDWPGSRTAR